MASAAVNPQALLATLKSMSGGQAGPAGAATGTPSAGESLGPAVRELSASDPNYALKQISNLKKQIADMIPTLAFKAPAASRALVSCFKGLDAAIKELQQATATMNAVGGAVKNSAVPQPQPPSGDLNSPDITKSSNQGL